MSELAITPLQVRWFRQLAAQRAIAVIRAKDWQIGLKMSQAAIEGGLKMIEITWNSDQAAHIIETLRSNYPTVSVGAGTILSKEMLKSAIASGASFAFSPIAGPQLITIAHHFNIPIVLGGMTPSEIQQAWQWGSDGVKVFPIKAVGGSEFIRCLQGPLSHIPLIPTGGATLKNASILIEAGAIAVGLSSDLFPKNILKKQDWSQLTQRINQFHPSTWDISRNSAI